MANSVGKVASSQENSYDGLITSLEQNQVILEFVGQINALKKNGHKSFGVMSLGYPELQHRVLIASAGLVKRYNVREKLGLVINSRSVVLQKVIKQSSSELADLNDKKIPYYNFHNRFDITSLERIASEYQDDHEIEYSKLLEEFNDKYDTVLWDLPLIGDIKANYHHYIPILDEISNVFLVLSGAGSTKDEIDKIKEYFSNFNVKISGVILNSSEEKKSKWWEFWK